MKTSDLIKEALTNLRSDAPRPQITNEEIRDFIQIHHPKTVPSLQAIASTRSRYLRNFEQELEEEQCCKACGSELEPESGSCPNSDCPSLSGAVPVTDDRLLTGKQAAKLAKDVLELCKLPTDTEITEIVQMSISLLKEFGSEAVVEMLEVLEGNKPK